MFSLYLCVHLYLQEKGEILPQHSSFVLNLWLPFNQYICHNPGLADFSFHVGKVKENGLRFVLLFFLSII